MAFLVKYIAFVVAVLSAAKLGEGIKQGIIQVDPSDAKSVQKYADLVKQGHCESFNPTKSTHMDAIGDCKRRRGCKKTANTLAQLLTAQYLGDNIEMCVSKEEDRWSSWKEDLSWGFKEAGKLVSIGAPIATAAINKFG